MVHSFEIIGSVFGLYISSMRFVETSSLSYTPINNKEKGIVYMFGLLNLGSLLLGLITWILPILNLTRDKKQNKNWVVLSMISICACGISLCSQIFYTYYKVTVEDWSALMDTMYAVAYVSAILLTVTIILNVITLKVYRGRTVE